MAPCIMNWALLSPGCTLDVRKITCFGFFLLGGFDSFSLLVGGGTGVPASSRSLLKEPPTQG